MCTATKTYAELWVELTDLAVHYTAGKHADRGRVSLAANREASAGVLESLRGGLSIDANIAKI